MAKIKFRRDTAADWTQVNPVLAQGEPGFEYDTGLLKIGDGGTAWNSLPYSNTGGSGNALTNTDGVNSYSVGVNESGVVTMTTARGGLEFGAMPEPGAPQHLHIMRPEGQESSTDLFFGDDFNYIKLPGNYGDGTQGVEIGSSLSEGTVHTWRFGTDGELTLPAGGDIVDSTGASVLGGGGLPTVTVPSEIGTVYKGLQVSYGMVHSNSSNTELNVNKIVIHKPAQTTTTIHPTSSQDDFEVAGLSSSDIVAMFVFYGDANGPKSLTTLQTFAQAVIDNVILDGGVEGQYQTVDQMKAAFYASGQQLQSAAGGLVANFEFWQNEFSISNGYLSTGTTTVRQGSGAIFDIADNGDGTYLAAGIQNPGAHYRAGHKILILGTDLGGATPDNDCIVTIDSVVDVGAIFQWSVSGTAAGNVAGMLYTPLTGTNYQVGSGFAVDTVYRNGADGLITGINTSSSGTGYVVGDVLTLPGTAMTNGVSPDNDITITVTGLGNLGELFNWTNEGTMPQAWPNNSISDGGEDQYDTANYINFGGATEIPYNNGDTVSDSASTGGPGTAYAMVYDNSIFGVLVAGSIDSIGTSGGSGADGSSTTEAGNIYGPSTAAQTFDSAVKHINLIGDPYAGAIVSFTHSDNGNEVDILIPDDGDGAGVGITRDGNNGIYNPYRDNGWDQDISPSGIGWNIDGWADLSDVEDRTYINLYAAFGFGGLGNKIVGTECVIYLPDNGKYYALKFDSWTQNNNGGGFSYTRRELDLTSLSEGIRFADGTRLKSAEGLGRVKLESPNNRRIEEAHGYKQVTVTERTEIVISTTASRSVTNSSDIWAETASTTIDNIISDFETYEVVLDAPRQFSLDNINWYNFTGGYSSVGNESVFYIDTPVTYNLGDTIYFRYTGGGTPTVWWNKADLPGGSANFRGAVIDYHAYTGEATIIGTIHIVDDDGEENITHTEVSSGSTDSENDDLWLVQNEGTISYRRIDGEGKTLKVQWTAKVFYGSELYD